MSNELGRLEDLPADYVQDLRDLNLVPLWPSLRGVLPPHEGQREYSGRRLSRLGCSRRMKYSGRPSVDGER